MNQKKIITVLAALVLIFGGITIYFLTAQKSIAPVVQSTPVTPLVQNENANWQTYSNAEYGFELRYPKNYTVSINQTSDFYHVSFMNETGMDFYVKVDLLEKKDGSGYHLDYEPVHKTTLGGINANKFILNEGYCDGPGCSPVIVAVKAYYKGLNYIINFYGVTEISGINEQIISTFKFTK